MEDGRMKNIINYQNFTVPNSDVSESMKVEHYF